MLFTAAVLMLLVLAIPVSIGGFFLARACLRRGVARKSAAFAYGLNIAVFVLTVLLAIAIATGLNVADSLVAIVGIATVYVLPLATIASVVLDAMMLSAMLAASRESSRRDAPQPGETGRD